MTEHFADYIHPTRTELDIKPIVGGYTVTSYFPTDRKFLTTFHPNWISILKHLDLVYGEIERTILKERAKEKDKE